MVDELRVGALLVTLEIHLRSRVGMDEGGLSNTRLSRPLSCLFDVLCLVVPQMVCLWHTKGPGPLSLDLAITDTIVGMYCL